MNRPEIKEAMATENLSFAEAPYFFRFAIARYSLLITEIQIPMMMFQRHERFFSTIFSPGLFSEAATIA
jgi:hypothetical protein